MVVDPDDALIPGATVTLTSASGKAQTTTSKSDGTYTFRGVAGGHVHADGDGAGVCQLHQAAISVTAGANVTSDVKMTLQDTTQTVNVTHRHGAAERGSGEQRERDGDYGRRAECAIGRSG